MAEASDPAGRVRRSAPEPQALDHLLVPGRVLALEIVEQAAPLADHDEQAAPRVEILGMRREVVGEIADALAEDGDLHLRRAGVALLAGVFLDELLLARQRDRHRVSPCLKDSAHAPAAALPPRPRRAPPACRRWWRKPSRRRRADRCAPGRKGAAASRPGRDAGGGLRLPSRPGPGCRPARSRPEEGARKRPHYAPGRPVYPGKSPARGGSDRPQAGAARRYGQ